MSISQNPPSRSAFIAAGIGAGLASAADPAGADPLLDVDYGKLVSRADLVYEKPVPRSEEGIPIGNGRMGSLVWTTPTQLRFQINRVDVYSSNCASNSFFERHTDYCGGCGFVDIDFGGRRDSVSRFRFSAAPFGLRRRAEYRGEGRHGERAGMAGAGCDCGPVERRRCAGDSIADAAG